MRIQLSKSTKKWKKYYSHSTCPKNAEFLKQLSLNVCCNDYEHFGKANYRLNWVIQFDIINLNKNLELLDNRRNRIIQSLSFELLSSIIWFYGHRKRKNSCYKWIRCFAKYLWDWITFCRIVDVYIRFLFQNQIKWWVNNLIREIKHDSHNKQDYI